jgi:hypothetical protein
MHTVFLSFRNEREIVVLNHSHEPIVWYKSKYYHKHETDFVDATEASKTERQQRYRRRPKRNYLDKHAADSETDQLQSTVKSYKYFTAETYGSGDPIKRNAPPARATREFHQFEVCECRQGAFEYELNSMIEKICTIRWIITLS